MPQVAAAAAVVGTGIQVYGAIKSANDQAQLDADRADVARKQAIEIGEREQANESIRDQQAMRQKLQFGASFAASGKAGTGVGSQLQIQNQSDLLSMMSNREAKFQEQMLYTQAGIDTTLAQNTLEAGTLTAIGTGLSGVGSAAGIATSGGSNPGYGGTQSLGSYPSTAGPSLGVDTRMPSLGAGAYGGGE